MGPPLINGLINATGNGSIPYNIGVCPDKTCQNKPVPFWQVGRSYYVAVEVDRMGRALFG